MGNGLRVIGVGMHRTGSLSVKVALERLGFGPCYHGIEAIRRWEHGEHWMAAYEADGAIDWSRIFEGYQATLDWPSIYFWEQLAEAYPHAKILLTDRDPERWWNSHARMFEGMVQAREQLAAGGLAEEPGFMPMSTAMARIMWDNPKTFGGKHLDKEHCLQLFERHYDRVRSTVPADRLLVYRVQDGWEPLCRFLEVDVPDEPFPHVNAGDDLFANIRTAIEQGQTGTPDREAAWH